MVQVQRRHKFVWLSSCCSLGGQAIVRSMESRDRSTSLCRSQQRATIASVAKGKATPALSIPAIRVRSNQDDNEDSESSCSTASSQTMQRSTSAFDSPHHEAATSSTSGRSKSVLVLRRCEDLNIRTGGFQKIEETAHRLDIRRARQPQPFPARDHHAAPILSCQKSPVSARKLS